jgi:hypothetical protein
MSIRPSVFKEKDAIMKKILFALCITAFIIIACGELPVKPPFLPAPDNFEYAGRTNGVLYFQYDEVPEADGYVLFRRCYNRNSSDYYVKKEVSYSGTRNISDSPPEGSEYSYFVRATNSQTAGHYSDNDVVLVHISDTNSVYVYEPNDTSSDAVYVSNNMTITAYIHEDHDFDYYAFTLGSGYVTNYTITLSNLPRDYDLFVYEYSLTKESTNRGTSNEVITGTKTGTPRSCYVKVQSSFVSEYDFSTNEPYTLVFDFN